MSQTNPQPEVVHGPPTGPWALGFTVETNPISGPFDDPSSPAPATDLPLVPRVPEATSASGKNRLDRFTKIIQSIINSLLGQGILQQTGPSTWTLNAPSTGGPFQPLDQTLTALAANNWSLNAFPIGSGPDTLSQIVFGPNTFPARDSTGNLVPQPISNFVLGLVKSDTAADVATAIGAVTGTGAAASGSVCKIALWSTAHTLIASSGFTFDVGVGGTLTLPGGIAFAGSGVIQTPGTLTLNAGTSGAIVLSSDGATTTFGSQVLATPTRLAFGYNQSAPTADQNFVFGFANVCTTSASNASIVGLANSITGTSAGNIFGESITISGSGTLCLFAAGAGNNISGGTSFCVIGSSNTITASCIGAVGNSNTVSGARSLAMGTLANVTRAGVINWAMPDSDPIFNLQKWSDTNTMRDVCDIVATWTTATDASRKGRVSFFVYDTAAREAIRLDTDGATPSSSVAVGASTAFAKVGGAIFDHYADQGNTTTSETDLYSDTIPANAFSVNGQKITAHYAGTLVSSATATRELRVYFGGTMIFDTGALSLSVAGDWVIDVVVIRDSSTSVRCDVKANLTGPSTGAYANYQAVTGLTLTGTTILKITGQAGGVGAATNDIVAKLGTVSWLPAA